MEMYILKKYINQADMRNANAADVFALIRKMGGMTRKELAEKTGLSWGAVSTISTELLENHFIREFKCEKTQGAGRTPSRLEVNSDGYFVLGLDINASGFRAVLLNLKNEVTLSLTATPAYEDRASLLSEIISFIRKALCAAEDKTVLGIGIAMQGPVDAKSGVSVSLTHVRDWANVPLAKILRKEFSLPVFVAHDPDCILYAVSAEKVYKDAILLRVDEGIGMSVLLGGKIFDRPGMFEIGHTVAVPDGAVCACGKRGCLEGYASQRGLSTRSGKPFSDLVAATERGDAKSLSLFTEMASLLAISVSNFAFMLQIQNVVLCGDMWNYREFFWDTFSKSAPPSLSFSFSSVENAATGAALIAIERLISELDFRKEDTE